jgi:Xaa-Pro aminopeptidase
MEKIMVKVSLKKIEKLKMDLNERGLDGALIFQPENRRYYSGFSGSNAWLLISLKYGELIFTDGRYFEQAIRESPHFTLTRLESGDGKAIWPAFVRFMKQHHHGNKLAYEAESMTVEQYHKLQAELPGIMLEPADRIISSARILKEPDEIGEIRKAVSFAEIAFREIENKIKAGISERELGAELEYRMKLAGAKQSSFEPIIASGVNSSLPHARPSEKLLKEGEPITLDWGAKTDSGYCSDMTRTLFIGKPDEKMLKIYRVVLESQMTVLDRIKPGMTTGQTDEIARKIISDAGYGEYFSHGLGHGLGLAIHEAPTVRNGDETVLKPGMIVTVEPGIYIPGEGGVRIEDLVLITNDGKEILTSLPKIEY